MAGFRPLTRLLLLPISLACVSLLASCKSTPEKPAGTKYAEMKMQQRMAMQFKDPRGISTGFQQKVFKASKEVEGNNFKTNQFTGMKLFKSNRYKTPAFAQADKMNRVADKDYAGSEIVSPLADSTYTGASLKSKLGGESNYNAGKVSPLANDTYRTRYEPLTRKAQEKAPHPKMLDEESPSMSEFDIRKLLNKDG